MFIAVIVESKADIDGEAGCDLEVGVNVRSEAVGAGVGERNAFRSLGRIGTSEKEARKSITARLGCEAQEPLFEVGSSALDVDAIKLGAELEIVLSLDPGKVGGWLEGDHIVESVAIGQLLQCERQARELRDAMLAVGQLAVPVARNSKLADAQSILIEAGVIRSW